MKAILVIDMPKECWDCPMHIEGLDDENEEIMVCNAEKIESHYGEKPSWCPLKPMPEKKWVAEGFDRIMENNKEHLMSLGWNDCIDEILGEEK